MNAESNGENCEECRELQERLEETAHHFRELQKMAIQSNEALHDKENQIKLMTNELEKLKNEVDEAKSCIQEKLQSIHAQEEKHKTDIEALRHEVNILGSNCHELQSELDTANQLLGKERERADRYKTRTLTEKQARELMQMKNEFVCIKKEISSLKSQVKKKKKEAFILIKVIIFL